MYRNNVLIKQPQRDISLLLLHVNHSKKIVNQEVCEPGRGFPPEWDHTGILIQDSQLPELWGMHICCLLVTQSVVFYYSNQIDQESDLFTLFTLKMLLLQRVCVYSIVSPLFALSVLLDTVTHKRQNGWYHHCYKYKIILYNIR